MHIRIRFREILPSATKGLLMLTALILAILAIQNYLNNLSVCRLSGQRSWIADYFRNFAIRTTWNGDCVKHEPVKISLKPSPDGGMKVKVLAPFFNSPAKPPGLPGYPQPGLWEYEVVEMFFLNNNKQYLEVELCPHGQHLLLMLNGVRKIVQDQLQLTTFNATIQGDRWTGEAIIPRSYFPPNVAMFNAYAIHGDKKNRVYEALYPANPSQAEPDFHRLEYFQPIDITEVLDNYQKNEVSELWKKYI